MGEPSPNVNTKTALKTSVGQFRAGLVEIHLSLVLQKNKNERVLILLWQQILTPRQSPPDQTGLAGAISPKLWFPKLEIMALLLYKFQICSAYHVPRRNEQKILYSGC